MKKYTIDEPEFNKTLIITETTDTGHADNINKAPKMAFENTLYLEKTKLNADEGDVSETVIETADEIEDEEYPIPAAGDKPRTFLGKTKKFLGNIKDWMAGVCLLGQIVNNCVTDNAKLPLSAAQGKVLMDLYNVLNTNQQNTATTVKEINSSEFRSGTVLNMANSPSRLPASFMKTGSATVSDVPCDDKLCEFACVVYGHDDRRTVIFTRYGTNDTYVRTIFRKDWYVNGWVKIST